MKLRTVFEHVAYLREKRAFRELHAFLDRNGWGRRTLAGNVAIVHFSPCGRFVLKYSRKGRSLNLVTGEDLERFPILRQYWLRPILWTPKVAIQPFVERAGRKESCPIRNRLFAEYGSHMDVCDANVGYWRGRLWVIDCTVKR